MREINKLVKSIDLIAFEDEVAKSFNAGEIRAPVHLSSGNEEQLIEIFAEVKPTDWVFCSWRSHYQALLKGVPPQLVKKKIMEGKSISLCFPDHQFYSSAIVGGIVPQAVGVAWSIKKRGVLEHVWCFIGDMTSEGSAAFLGIKYAENFDLPITFVVEDNGVSVCTDTKLTWNQPEPTWRIKTSRKVRYYQYSSKYPHAGAGFRVQF